MKAKTIKSVLRKKIDEWAESIEDESVRELVKRNTIVTGGAIASMLLAEPVNDFDIYFRNRETTLAVAKYYVDRFTQKAKNGIPGNVFRILHGVSDRVGVCAINVIESEDRIKVGIKSAGIASEDGTDKPYEYFESQPEGEGGKYIAEVMDNPGDIEDLNADIEQAAQQVVDDGKPRYRPVFMSTNAITLSHRIQVVLRFFGEPDEIHKNYDFIHCTNYWCSWSGELTLRAEALESLLSRELKYVGSKYPVCSIIRLRKFIKRNWTINAGQILKILMQVSALDLTDIAVLEDQLTGVDCAYFLAVLRKMRERDPDKINTAYLVEIIDRMF